MFIMKKSISPILTYNTFLRLEELIEYHYLQEYFLELYLRPLYMA